MPGCPAHLDNSRPTVLAVGAGGYCLASFCAGGDCLDIFLLPIIPHISPTLSRGWPDRLKCCLKWLLITQNNLPFSFEETVSFSVTIGAQLLTILVKISCDWQVPVEAS